MLFMKKSTQEKSPEVRKKKKFSLRRGGEIVLAAEDMAEKSLLNL